MPAMVLVGPGGPQGVSSFSGIFNGYELEKENGAHLTSYTLNSAFAGHWVHKLTFVAWFKLDPSYTYVIVILNLFLLTHDESVKCHICFIKKNKKLAF